MISGLLICGAPLLAVPPIVFVYRRAWHMAGGQVPPPVLSGGHRHSETAKQ